MRTTPEHGANTRYLQRESAPTCPTGSTGGFALPRSGEYPVDATWGNPPDTLRA